jgi:hypothetical protein
MTSKRDSPNETKVKEKQNKTIPDLNSNLAKSMTYHNQTNELITWFLTLSTWWTRMVIDQATPPTYIPPSGDQRRPMPEHPSGDLAQNLNPHFNVVRV